MCVLIGYLFNTTKIVKKMELPNFLAIIFFYFFYLKNLHISKIIVSLHSNQLIHTL